MSNAEDHPPSPNAAAKEPKRPDSPVPRQRRVRRRWRKSTSLVRSRVGLNGTVPSAGTRHEAKPPFIPGAAVCDRRTPGRHVPPPVAREPFLVKDVNPAPGVGGYPVGYIVVNGKFLLRVDAR